MAYADVRCSQSKMASVVLWVLCSKYLGVKLNCFSGSSYHAYQVVDSEQDLHLYFWEKQKKPHTGPSDKESSTGVVLCYKTGQTSL